MNQQAVVGKVEKFFAPYRRFRYRKHEMIIRGDDMPTGVYFIQRGYVKLYSLSETGQEFILIIFKPHDLFPIRWAVTGSPHTYYFETMTSVELSRAPREKFIEFIKDSSEVSYELLDEILTRLGGLLERMEYAVFGSAYKKTASILIICGERFGVRRGKKVSIGVPLTHKDIASLIGLTRETTSVEISKLEKKGICSKEGQYITINSMVRLKNEAHWSESI